MSSALNPARVDFRRRSEKLEFVSKPLTAILKNILGSPELNRPDISDETLEHVRELRALVQRLERRSVML
jgi:hypothetical protein